MTPHGDNNDLPGLDRRLTTPTAERWSSRLSRRRLTPVLAVAALGSVMVAAPVAAQVVDESPSTTDTSAPDTSSTDTTAPGDSTTTTTTDPFDVGVPVTDVAGDSTTTTPPNPSTMKIEGGKVKDVRGDGINTIQATGSQVLNGGGVDFFVNTDITFATSSSASAAMSEASFTVATDVTTLNGGSVSSTLNDAFDGYNTLCLDVSGGNAGSCETGNANFEIYNGNGPATLACSNRAVVFPEALLAGVDVSRQVYVPAGSQWGRWLNSFTNSGASPVTFRAAIANNLGSDSNTINTGSASGQWYGTMQNYSGTTSSDPRLGHVLGQSGAPLAPSDTNFVDGDDNPFWGYSITLQPGETISFLNYVTVQGTKAGANGTAAALSAGTVTGQFDCLSDTEKAQVANFVTGVAPPTTTSTPPTTEAPTTEAPTTEAPAVEATGTLPYTGVGEELLPLAGAGALVAGAGAVVAGATRRRLRRPGWRHRR
jgi:hypothetical protein